MHKHISHYRLRQKNARSEFDRHAQVQSSQGDVDHVGFLVARDSVRAQDWGSWFRTAQFASESVAGTSRWRVGLVCANCDRQGSGTPFRGAKRDDLGACDWNLVQIFAGRL
jgi:hypothetical protein